MTSIDNSKAFWLVQVLEKRPSKYQPRLKKETGKLFIDPNSKELRAEGLKEFLPILLIIGQGLYGGLEKKPSHNDLDFALETLKNQGLINFKSENYKPTPPLTFPEGTMP